MKGANPAPEDALVIAEALRRVRNAVGSCIVRADGSINQRDLYDALDLEFNLTQQESAVRVEEAP